MAKTESFASRLTLRELWRTHCVGRCSQLLDREDYLRGRAKGLLKLGGFCKIRMKFSCKMKVRSLKTSERTASFETNN